MGMMSMLSKTSTFVSGESYPLLLQTGIRVFSSIELNFLSFLAKGEVSSQPALRRSGMADRDYLFTYFDKNFSPTYLKSAFVYNLDSQMSN